MYDVLLGGFATAGEPDKVRHYEAVMKRERLKMSARGFSLVIKGYLKNGLVDEALWARHRTISAQASEH